VGQRAVVVYLQGEFDNVFLFSPFLRDCLSLGLATVDLIIPLAKPGVVVNLGYEKCALVFVLSELHENILGRSLVKYFVELVLVHVDERAARR
jgi:hypothetical protein